MSARDKLWELYQTPDTASAFGDALDDFAHELAEKIRKHAEDSRVKPHLIDGEWTGLRMGANVIDPKKEG